MFEQGALFCEGEQSCHVRLVGDGKRHSVGYTVTPPQVAEAQKSVGSEGAPATAAQQQQQADALSAAAQQPADAAAAVAAAAKPLEPPEPDQYTVRLFAPVANHPVTKQTGSQLLGGHRLCS